MQYYSRSERLGVAAHAAPERVLLPRRRVSSADRAVRAVRQGHADRAARARRQLPLLLHALHLAVLVVARLAEVRRAKQNHAATEQQ